MALKAGIVGLPNVGKSTLFNAITNSQVEAANYPFATIEPNVGVVELKDKRLDEISKLVNPKRILPAAFEFIDIAGLVEGASKGEGLGNKFLANIREADAIIQVVRCFDDDNITHVAGNVDPVRDAITINLELLLADLETINGVLKRVERRALQTKEKTLVAEMDLAKRALVLLEAETPLRKLDVNEDEAKILKTWNLLTVKPILYVGNVEEENVAYPDRSLHYKKLEKFAKDEGANCLGISAQIEGELSQLPDEDRGMFLENLEIKETGLSRLTREAFKLLNLSTYFTAGVQEVRAWTFKNNMSAPQCAGIIHTDFEKGFIKAEVMSYEDFIANGGENGTKDAGKHRLEGKDYIMKDGDIVHFRFNV